MLKLSDLALRPDLQFGPLLVSPSRRLVEGPGGCAHLEPLIMQAFLLLLEARGKVVTRSDLFNQCWGGVIVGDDSLNQTIAKLRRTLGQAAPGLLEIETIPRTGYRLTGENFQSLTENSTDPAVGSGDRPRLSRRLLVGGGVAVLGSLGLGLALRPRSNGPFDALLERGKEALRVEEPSSARYFEQAVAIEPDNAKAWGLLAYALASGTDSGPRAVTGRIAQAAERAARAALEINPNEPDALLAMTVVQSDMLDWLSREERFRRILAIDPDNTRAMRRLGQLMHGVGRCRDALAIIERAIAIDPLTPDHQLRKSMRLWVLGRVAEADRVIDRAMELWPSHRLVRTARLMIYAFTGRASAALEMVEDAETTPRLLSPAAASVWRSSLEALKEPTASKIAAARKANIEGAKATPAIAAWAILALSASGELDGAFEVANGFLLGRGSVIVRRRPEPSSAYDATPGWRNTYGLFTPPTRPMRLDRRFGQLANELGLTAYWKKGGIGPDAFLFKA